MRESKLLDLVEKLELFLYRKSAAVVALTEAFKRDLVRRGIDPRKIDVVINGVDLPRYAPRAKDADLLRQYGLEDRFVIGYIGTHGLAHDLGNVIAAAARLRERKDICFLFVGDGAAKASLEEQARAQGLDNVRFVAPRPKDEMPAHWSLCDAALIHLKNDPVFAEVIPSKIFEAMAMGLPLVLVAPAGEATRIVEREDAGVVVPAGQPDALAIAARTLADDGASRQRMATHSLAAAARYSRQRQAEDMERVLARVVNEARRGEAI
jgi:glycosyltransferase involved in cell wall biosynthesis